MQLTDLYFLAYERWQKKEGTIFVCFQFPLHFVWHLISFYFHKGCCLGDRWPMTELLAQSSKCCICFQSSQGGLRAL